MADLPKYPKLRMGHARWIKQNESTLLHIQDDLGLAKTGVPVPMEPVLSLP